MERVAHGFDRRRSCAPRARRGRLCSAPRALPGPPTTNPPPSRRRPLVRLPWLRYVNYCHTATDQCINDSDCAPPDAGPPPSGILPYACVYDPQGGRWGCAVAVASLFERPGTRRTRRQRANASTRRRQTACGPRAGNCGGSSNAVRSAGRRGGVRGVARCGESKPSHV
jgi:hypothetical protein